MNKEIAMVPHSLLILCKVIMTGLKVESRTCEVHVYYNMVEDTEQSSKLP